MVVSGGSRAGNTSLALTRNERAVWIERPAENRHRCARNDVARTTLIIDTSAGDTVATEETTSGVVDQSAPKADVAAPWEGR